MSIDVEGTAISCYSGCLTSSSVLVYGASPQCHDGSIMEQFLLTLGCVMVAVLLASVAFQYRESGFTTRKSSTHTDTWSSQDDARFVSYDV
jgi:hypothetical protein